MFNEEVTKDIVELGWRIEDNDGICELVKHSNLGEELCVSGETIEEIIHELSNFDVDDHVRMHIEAESKVDGMELSPSELVDDARDIKKQFRKLKAVILEKPKMVHSICFDCNRGTTQVVLDWHDDNTFTLKCMHCNREKTIEQPEK